MKKKNKIYIAAAACIGVGIIFTAGGIMAGGIPGVSVGSDGIRMMGDTNNQEDYILEKTKLEEFSSVEMNLEYGNFSLIPSDGYYLEYCLSSSSQKPKYEVNNKTLVFDEKPVVNYVQFQIMNIDIPSYHGKYYVNLYVPEEVYFDTFVLNNGSGDAEFEKLKAESIELNLEYGKLTADVIEGDTVELVLDSGNLEAGEVTGRKNLEITMSYGDLTAETLAAEEMTIQNSSGNLQAEKMNADREGIITMDYGDLQFEDCTAESLKLTLESGSITLGTCKTGDMEMNLSYGNLKAQSIHGDTLTVENESGDVEINELILSEKGTLTLEYGNAEVALGEPISGYTMKLDTEYGTIHVPDFGRLRTEDGEESFRLDGSQGKSLDIYCNSGDITVSDTSAQ